MVKIFGRPEMESSKDIVNVSYPDITKDVKEGDDLLFDDGAIDMKVVRIPALCSWQRSKTTVCWAHTRA